MKAKDGRMRRESATSRVRVERNTRVSWIAYGMADGPFRWSTATLVCIPLVSDGPSVALCCWQN